MPRGQHTSRRSGACMRMESWASPPLAVPWPAKHLDPGEVEGQGDSGKASAQFPVALRPNPTLGSAGGAVSKLWAVELMRPHFLWICVLRLDFPVSEDHRSAKEALSVVRVFTASPSASPPRILPPGSNWSCAQAAGSPRAMAGYPSSPGCSPSWALPPA